MLDNIDNPLYNRRQIDNRHIRERYIIKSDNFNYRVFSTFMQVLDMVVVENRDTKGEVIK